MGFPERNVSIVWHFGYSCAKRIEMIKVVVALNYIGVHHHACERDGEEILSNKKRERW